MRPEQWRELEQFWRRMWAEAMATKNYRMIDIAGDNWLEVKRVLNYFEAKATWL